MSDEGKSPATIYARVSFLSSFYRWAMSQPAAGTSLRQNPALLARPKAHTLVSDGGDEGVDEELQAITDVVRQKAASRDLVAKRDLTLLLLYTSTGLRREEVISLHGQDISVEKEGLIISGRAKGGRYRARAPDPPDCEKRVFSSSTNGCAGGGQKAQNTVTTGTRAASRVE